MGLSTFFLGGWISEHGWWESSWLLSSISFHGRALRSRVDARQREIIKSIIGVISKSGILIGPKPDMQRRIDEQALSDASKFVVLWLKSRQK